MRLGLTNTISANGAGGLNADQLALDLQFAADKTLTARKGPTPTFTRVSGGTFVGSDGLVQIASSNVARFDHDPVTLASKGLLIEEQRQNLYQRSENFADAFWIKTRSSIQSDATTAPDGTTTADKLIEDTTASSTHAIGSAVTPTATPHTLSVFAKKGERNFIVLRLGGSNDFFNLDTGAALTNINSPTITNYGNGWYRCTVTSSAGTQGSFQMSADGITTSYTGDGTSGVFIWGAQLEAGSFASSYIPTTTSSVVRSADVCSITGLAFSGMWNSSEGTLFASGDPRAVITATYVMANSGGNANQVSIYRIPLTGYFGVAASGSFTAQITSSSANGSFNKVAGSYATNDVRSAANGVLGTPDSIVTVPTNLTRLNIGSAGLTNSEFANGSIAAIRYFRKPFSNAKLQALTA